VPDKSHVFSQKPQINLSWSSTGRMWLITGCAFMCVLQSSFKDGGQSFKIAVTALAAALITELILTQRSSRTSKIRDGSTAATAMILVMLLPNMINPIYAAMGSIFAVIVIKYSFGGLGSNWLNPALGGWLFIRISWPSAFTEALGNVGSSIAEVQTAQISALDNSAAEFLNNTILSVVDIQLPSGYIDLLFSNNPGLIIDRGLFALLIGTIIITAFGINRGWIPLVFLSVYGFLIRFAGDLNGTFWNGDTLYGLFSGGTIAAAFILAAEPSSGAKLKGGVFITVILGAVFSWFFRYYCMEYSGCFIAVIFVNCLTPLIRLVEERFIFSRSNRSSSLEKVP
jgi:electron transport complex protein RnfD